MKFCKKISMRKTVAVYEGVQFAGMITAFYDYLCDDKDLMIGEEELNTFQIRCFMI